MGLSVLDSYLKKIIRKVSRMLGVEVSRYRPYDAGSAQLVKAFEVGGLIRYSISALTKGSLPKKFVIAALLGGLSASSR